MNKLKGLIRNNFALSSLVLTMFLPGTANCQKTSINAENFFIKINKNTFSLDAKQIFKEWTSTGVNFNSDKNSIELNYGELYEDDGPAAGYSYTPNTEKLSQSILARKDLIVPNPKANGATILIQHKGEPSLTLNGKQIHSVTVPGAGLRWKAYEIDPQLLHKGKNTLIIGGNAELPIALEENYAKGSLSIPHHPNRSARSKDGGATWNYSGLGTNERLDGEYFVRLFLDHYQSKGSLVSPVMDVRDLHQGIIASTVVQLSPVQVRIMSNAGPSGKIIRKFRTGSTPIPSDKTWSKWTDFRAEDSVIMDPQGVYIQLSIDLLTSDPLQTPSLDSIFIQARHITKEDWYEKVNIIKSENKKIVRSAIDFKYEPFGNQKLDSLRKKYNLDGIVKGSATEFEMITRLAGWASKKWNKKHLSEFYPSWNALEILKTHSDGLPVGGFCLQYNLTFLQACESFGLVGRVISIGPGEVVFDHKGGHEVVEIWSNEFRKWIYVDGNMAWYATDEKDVPLSLMELHDRQLDVLNGKVPKQTKFVHIAAMAEKWTSLKNWPPFVELRMIPRSNFLEETYPLPLNQGMYGWPWTGHFLWSSNRTQSNLNYSNRLTRKENWDWSVNEVYAHLEATKTPGVLRVFLETVTPGFKTFYCKKNDSEPIQVPEIFEWILQPGVNKLTINSVNIKNRKGPPTYLELEWKP